MECLPIFFRFITYSPENSFFHQLLESRIAPGALIMPVSRVENTTAAMLLYPCPRFAMIVFDSLHQHRDILSEFIMNIGFIPGFKLVQRLNNRVILFYDINGK